MLDHILVPLDGSPLAESVLPHVVAMGRALAPRISLLHVVQRDVAPDMIPTTDPLDWQLRRAEAEAYLEEVAARLQTVGVAAETTVTEGPSAERIIGYAHDEKVDLILLSSHGRGGLSEWNVSSVVQKIILRAFCPPSSCGRTSPTPGSWPACTTSACWCRWMAHSGPNACSRWRSPWAVTMTPG